ncbi:hypothetical protein BD410DRAFT_810575 [Rickenella mellea]|uniref:Uncharacterized protein n=1 Tax=Rickenella mellea TaxID=50990 RepID=A0A4Y7PEI0_9AGAM|nr:hypothetical protein BD410DRAFT_810575 [Rickenella mellea]
MPFSPKQTYATLSLDMLDGAGLAHADIRDDDGGMIAIQVQNIEGDFLGSMKDRVFFRALEFAKTLLLFCTTRPEPVFPAASNPKTWNHKTNVKPSIALPFVRQPNTRRRDCNIEEGLTAMSIKEMQRGDGARNTTLQRVWNAGGELTEERTT